MNPRTYVCLNCQKSYRINQHVGDVNCPICHDVCEYVHWKIRTPSPKRKRQWKQFWVKYKAEKALLEQFKAYSSITEIRLDILNQRWIRTNNS